MKINAYLMFNGECKAAFEFYQRTLGGKIAYMSTYGESPMAAQTPPQLRERIMHARLIVGDGETLMGSDAPPDRYEKTQGCSMTIGVEDPAEAERLFQALSENGKIDMPIQETFWAQRFGMLVDQFGIPWMVNCEKIPA